MTLSSRLPGLTQPARRDSADSSREVFKISTVNNVSLICIKDKGSVGLLIIELNFLFSRTTQLNCSTLRSHGQIFVWPFQIYC